MRVARIRIIVSVKYLVPARWQVSHVLVCRMGLNVIETSRGFVRVRGVNSPKILVGSAWPLVDAREGLFLLIRAHGCYFCTFM